MIVSPYCKKHDMNMRLLTINHCQNRNKKECEYGSCKNFGMKLRCPTGM